MAVYGSAAQMASVTGWDRLSDHPQLSVTMFVMYVV
jgi:poly(3-hydroxybutyrate) depolymerase